MWSFAKLPSDPPPPVWHFFKKKNLPPFFLLKIASLMAETNFTLGPTSKTNKFPLLFLVIVGQNSQHKRANLNGRTPLDIYSNNFRPSVKHVLGVLEWFYMLTEKILFQNRGLAFYYPPRPPPPPVWQKTRLFPDFHLCTLPLVVWLLNLFARLCVQDNKLVKQDRRNTNQLHHAKEYLWHYYQL